MGSFVPKAKNKPAGPWKGDRCICYRQPSSRPCGGCGGAALKEQELGKPRRPCGGLASGPGFPFGHLGSGVWTEVSTP